MTNTLTLPHWIDGRRPLFACFHGPISDARDLGVLVCKSFGHEMMSTHRAVRHLAERLAEAGFPTLRLDYDGTGDSSGGDTDPDRGARWLDSIGDGVAALRRRGASRVALVGIRFGALLALEYARTRPVDTLVLVGPPASGKGYLRELRAIQSFRFKQPLEAAPGTTPGEEIVGFFLRSDAASFLTDLGPSGPVAPARRALVVPRDDLPGGEHRLAERLTALGVRVTLSSTKGYASMIDADPVKAAVPQAVWKEVAQWMGEDNGEGIPPMSGSGNHSRVAEVRLTEDTPAIKEEIFDVGGMFGILSRPPQLLRDAPLVVLPNTGANHHVGSNRMYVEFARQWAALGFHVMRFDLSGVGDSPAAPGRRENDIYSEASIGDAGRVLRWASEVLDANRFVLGGVCSGAYVSYYAAMANASVAAVMLMNPLTFQWREGDSLETRARSTVKSTDFYLRAALEWETWARLARQNVQLRAIAPVIAKRAWRRLTQGKSTREGTDVAMGFQRLCERGTRIVLVCGEDDASRDVVSEHLGPNAQDLSQEDGFQFDIVRATDHTFAPFGARRELRDLLTRHLQAGLDPLNGEPARGTDARRRLLWASKT